MNGNDNPEGQDNAPNSEPVVPVREPRDTNPTGQPATAQQLEQAETRIEERMSGFERSMLRLTRTGVVIGIVTGFIFAGQLYEMITGGTQTDQLVGYAQQQSQAAKDMANAAKGFAQSASEIESHTKDAVKAMQDSADAAQTSANVAKQTLKAQAVPSIGIVFTRIYNDPTAKRLGYAFEFKNFSNAKAYNATFRQCPIVAPGFNYDEIYYPAKPVTVNAQQQGIQLEGEITIPIEYLTIMDKKVPLTVLLLAKYDGADKKHYTFCEQHRFIPEANAFSNLGPCDSRQEANVEDGCKQ